MELKKGVLSGIRVVDFGQYIAGPTVSMILGDYGADVIHIDPPKGPVWNGWECNAALMRGKRNISLDLKNKKDLDITLKLIDRADVLVENFHPGVMDRLGLGWKDLEKRNPGLVYCSLPGFSKEDEKRRDWPGWEGIISAEGGLYSSTDYINGKDSFQFDALPLASMFAAVIACHSVAAALIVREKCGKGQYIESSLYDACFEIDSTRTVQPKGIAVPGSNERSNESKNASLCMRLMNNYPCKDGRYIKTTPPPRGQVSLCKALFPESWLQEGPPENAGETVRKIMLTRTMREWEEYGQTVHGAGVSVSLTSDEWLREESSLASRTSVMVKDPVLGDTLQPGVPSIMTGSGDSCGRERHLPDADRNKIIQELECAKSKALNAAAGVPELPLKGIKILDLSQVVAGPTAGRILAEYGAEVIKINNPRFSDNFTALVGHETQCNGKKTMLLDIKSDEGKRVMDALIRECDVFHSNFSQEAYIHLGFTEEELRKKNPGIIVSQVNIHSLGGGREWMRGHEDLGEAASGMSLRYSGTLKPRTLPILVLDHMTGQMSALGVLLAVYGRLLTGKGQKVQASLSRSATLVQLPYMLSYEGKVWDEPSGPGSWGFSQYDRMYKASDGYIYLHSDPEAVKTIPDLAEMPWDDPAAMENAFLGKTCSEWESICCSNKCFARRCRIYRNDICADEYAWDRGIVKNEMHPGLGMIRTVHCAPRMSLTPPQPGYPSSAPGSDTEAVIDGLKEKGLL